MALLLLLVQINENGPEQYEYMTLGSLKKIYKRQLLTIKIVGFLVVQPEAVDMEIIINIDEENTWFS